MPPTDLPAAIDTTRLTDPVYLASAYRTRGDLHPNARVMLDRAVCHMLASFASLTDRDHVVAVIREGIDDALDLDTSSQDWAEGAYRALVRDGLIAGQA